MNSAFGIGLGIDAQGAWIRSRETGRAAIAGEVALGKDFH